jgi:hypothetical protein
MIDPFAPESQMLERQIARAGTGKILDIGPGPNLFPPATHSVDWKRWPGAKTAASHQTFDATKERILGGPYDFVYCRHVVEDLRNPEALFANINRVGQRGYIETPSVCHELTVGVDRGDRWRGHHHHFWFCWVEIDFIGKPVFHLLTKNIAVNYFDIDVPALTSANWNTYYEFEEGVIYQLHELGKDCELVDGSYFVLLDRALKAQT